MKYDLATAKMAIKDLFPQVGHNFTVWQTEYDHDESFHLQQHDGQREYFGHVYIADLKAKTLTN